MTDAEFIMRQEAKRHKENGRAIYHRASRGGGKSCRLPSDNLTKAQLKKKNGELITVNMNKVINWEDFKEISPDLQRMYFENLRSKYNPKQIDVAKAMGVSPNTLSAHIRKKMPDFSFPNVSRNSPQSWHDFVNGISKDIDSNVAEETTIEIEPEIADTGNCGKEYDATFVNTMHGNVSFKGDPYAIFERAIKLFDEAKYYNITISFREENEEC